METVGATELSSGTKDLAEQEEEEQGAGRHNTGERAMDWLRQLFSRSRRRPDALSLSILNRVPLDILVYIMDYLSSESAVAFSLSCMHLKFLLGTRHFSKLTSEDTLALLNLLAIDLPDHIVCFPCKRLHNMENLHRYNSSTYSAGSTKWHLYASLPFPACVTKDRRDRTFVLTDLFGSTACKMAIKRYQGSDCTELLKLMSSKATKTNVVGNYVRQFKEECRVIRGCLMHRL